MKFKYLFAFILYFSFQEVSAQSQPWYTQYILNNFIINPALAGIENYWDLHASYRNQWTEISGAPITEYISAHGPLNGEILEDETPTTQHSQFNPRGYDYWNHYQSPPSHWGTGVSFINDKTGPLNNLSLKFSLAYHLKISLKTALSLGFSFGAQEISLNPNQTYFGIDNPIDPAIGGTNGLNKIKPGLDMGLWYYSSRYFMGFSVQQLIKQPINFNNSALTSNSNTISGTLNPQIFIQGGYKLFIGEQFSLLPSVTLRVIKPLPTALDLNLKLQYRDMAWIGATYRSDGAYSAMIGFNTNFNMNFGYSYDFTTKPLNSISGGTHEIIIGYTLRNNLHDRCPRNSW